MTLLTSLPLPHYTFSEFSGSHFWGAISLSFLQPWEIPTSEIIFESTAVWLECLLPVWHCQSSISCKLKGQKVLNGKMHSEARQPGHKQACETQPTLIFLNGAMSKCGLVKDRSERVSKVNGFPRGWKIPSVWRTAPRAPWPNKRDTYKEMRSLQQVKECRHCWRG